MKLLMQTINPFFGQLTDLVWIVGTLFDKKKVLTGEGLRVGKVRSCAVYLILAHFVFKSILWIGYFLWKDELTLNGRGSCAVCLVLAPSVSFCFQVNSLTKTMFFALNWIGLADHISRDRRAITWTENWSDLWAVPTPSLLFCFSCTLTQPVDWAER